MSVSISSESALSHRGARHQRDGWAPTIAGEGVTPHLSNANRWSGALTRALLPRSRELPSRVMTTDNPPLRQDNGPLASEAGLT